MDARSLTVSETVSVVTADATGNCGSSNDKEKYVQVEDVDENDKNKKRKLTIYVWLRVQNMVLKQSDKAILLNDELNDKYRKILVFG